jgi:hypothetical protein
MKLFSDVFPQHKDVCRHMPGFSIRPTIGDPLSSCVHMSPIQSFSVQEQFRPMKRSSTQILHTIFIQLRLRRIPSCK